MDGADLLLPFPRRCRPCRDENRENMVGNSSTKARSSAWGTASSSAKGKIAPLVFVLIVALSTTIASFVVLVLNITGRHDLASYLFYSAWGRFPSELQVTLAVIAIIYFWERAPGASVGLSIPSSADFALGIAGFLLYMNYKYYGDSILRGWLATGFPSFLSQHAAPHVELWLVWDSMVAVLFEELVTRAYIIERMLDLTGSRLASGIASFTVSLLIHAPGRSITVLAGVTPIILFMTLVYLWRRNIVPGFTAHFLGNAVIALMLTRSRWMLLWIFDPNRNWIILAVGAALYLLARSYFANRTISAER
jgi:membrane protease YdiL (CAAX protease family)